MFANQKKISLFSIFNYTLMIILCIIFIYPFIYTAAISFSGAKPIMEGKVLLYPKEFTLSAYQALFKDSRMMRSFIFTVELTVSGVAASIFATTFTAYPLSRIDFKGKNIFLNIIIFTMYFNGGLIPTYLLIKHIGLTNKMGALIFPNLIDTFLLIIMLNYFRGLPLELEEAGKVEGANNFTIFLRIILPLSLPVLATLTIFYSVGYWNTFFNALMYIQTPKKYPLQVILYQILSSTDTVTTNSNEVYSKELIPENLKGAIVIVTALPIIVIYPFLQKYFIKGATVGAVKG